MLRVTSKFVQSETSLSSLDSRLAKVEKKLEEMDKAWAEFIHSAGGLPGSETTSNLRKINDFIDKRAKEIQELKRRLRKLENRL